MHLTNIKLPISLAGLSVWPRLRANNTCEVVFMQFDDEINRGEKGHEVQRKIEIQLETGIVTLRFLYSSNRFSICRKIIEIVLCTSATCCNVY